MTENPSDMICELVAETLTDMEISDEEALVVLEQVLYKLDILAGSIRYDLTHPHPA